MIVNQIYMHSSVHPLLHLNAQDMQKADRQKDHPLNTFQLVFYFQFRLL